MDNNPPPPTFSRRLRSGLHRLEDGLLVGLLAVMLGLAAIQIFLRNVFDAGLVWSEVLVRVLVLWVGLAGAMVASRQNRHISIDLLDRYLPEQSKIYVQAVVTLFTALVCTAVTYYSFAFVRMEYADGGMVFARIPVWVCESIIPFGFAAMALRYYLLCVEKIKTLLRQLS